MTQQERDHSGPTRLAECSECGHVHFDIYRNTYRKCPLAGDVEFGCKCPMQPRSHVKEN